MLFLVLIGAVLVLVMLYYFRGRGITQGQRWLLAAILGGGLGNYVDRLAQPHGVVDFIDVKFFGLLGLQRWPTFNVADATTVVAGILLVISMIVMEAKERK